MGIIWVNLTIVRSLSFGVVEVVVCAGAVVVGACVCSVVAGGGCAVVVVCAGAVVVGACVCSVVAAASCGVVVLYSRSH